ncbi:unnamed protein product [Cercospora beticola]|nr:unnamed protein product [Cercospora beticola]
MAVRRSPLATLLLYQRSRRTTYTRHDQREPSFERVRPSSARASESQEVEPARSEPLRLRPCCSRGPRSSARPPPRSFVALAISTPPDCPLRRQAYARNITSVAMTAEGSPCCKLVFQTLFLCGDRDRRQGGDRRCVEEKLLPLAWATFCVCARVRVIIGQRACATRSTDDQESPWCKQ